MFVKKKNLRLLLVTIALVSFGNPVSNAATKGSALGWLKTGVKTLPVGAALVSMLGNSPNFLAGALSTIAVHSLIAGGMDLGAKTGKWIDTEINPQGTGEWGSVLGAGIVGGVFYGGMLGMNALSLPSILIGTAALGYSTTRTLKTLILSLLDLSSWGYKELWNTLSEKEEISVSATLKTLNNDASSDNAPIKLSSKNDKDTNEFLS